MRLTGVQAKSNHRLVGRRYKGALVGQPLARFYGFVVNLAVFLEFAVIIVKQYQLRIGLHILGNLKLYRNIVSRIGLYRRTEYGIILVMVNALPVQQGYRAFGRKAFWNVQAAAVVHTAVF